MPDRALLIGINAYPYVNPLNGCLNDVDEMSALLTSEYGFPAGSVHTLKDAEAVKDAIQSAVRAWLFTGARSGDRLVFHFSGHGSQVNDANDPTGLDEVLCLYDIDVARMDPGTYLTDKELGRLFAEVPAGVRFLAVFDSCHSGTGTRDLHAIRGWTPRFVAPPPRIQREIARQRTPTIMQPKNFAQRVQAELDRQRRASAASARSPELRLLVEAPLDYVFYAACRSDQTAKDAQFDDGQSHGAFTYYLTRSLESLGPEVDRSALDRRMDTNLERYDQQPQLEARSASGPLFPAVAAAVGGVVGADPVVPPDPVDEGPDPAPFPTEALRNLGLALGQLITWAERGAPKRAFGRAVTGKVLVTVHGIGTHPRGYSNAWWDAMKDYVPSLQPGDLDGKRQEVLWSNIVNDRALARDARSASAAEQIKEALRDRARRDLDSAVPPPGEPGPARADRAVGDRDFGIPDIGGIDDFVNYLVNPSVRDRVLNRFYDIVRPLLQTEHEIELISHSWGTVVAYEGLLNLEGLRGRVRNFFTVGSALSIFAVKPLLIPAARTGRKPSMVDRWVNLDARFDVVGGNLKDNPYKVDEEFLNLGPFGCSSWFPQPVCAHSSYFKTGNVAVNRDVFGAFIEH